MFARPLALLMFLAWGAYCLNASVLPLQRYWYASSAAVLVLAVVILVQNSQHMVAPLLLGYDNSAHIPGLSQVYRHSGFLYSGNLPELFTFSNYRNGYPPLQSGTWAFVMSIVHVRISGGYEVLNFFGFFFFGTALLIISLITRQWIMGLSRWFTGGFRTTLAVLVGLLIAFSQASYIFWLGYPPFLWACGIIIAIIGLITETENKSHRVFLALLGLTLVNYSYPLLSPVLVLVSVSELLKMSKTDFIYCWVRRKVISMIGLLTGALNVAVVLKSLNVRHFVMDTGGIQPIAIRNLLPILAIVISMSIVYRYSRTSLPVFVIAFLSSCANFAVLGILSQRDQGSVTYYPQKAGYLVLILGFACMGSMLGGSSRFIKPRHNQIFHVIATAAIFATLWFSVTATSDPNYAKYGFPSTTVIWDQLKHNRPNPNRDCLIHAMDITSDLNSNSNKQTILFLQDDLNTRWINGVRGRLTSATYSLSIPLGQGNQTLQEILKSWFIQYPQARLLILAPESPAGLEEWSDKIEYRQFVCV